MSHGATASELFFYVVIQGHRLPLPRGTSPRRPGLELIMALDLQRLRVPVMRARLRLSRVRVQLGQVQVLVDVSSPFSPFPFYVDSLSINLFWKVFATAFLVPMQRGVCRTFQQRFRRGLSGS